MTVDMVECLRKQGRHDIADEIERLRARILELEASVAIAAGTIRAHLEAEPPFRVTDTEPSTPR